jgi:N6-L-threonylcarbamoyladenine synthase
MAELGAERGVEVIVPRPVHCTDNAAMIALAGASRLAAGHDDGLEIEATANLAFGVPWSS